MVSKGHMPFLKITGQISGGKYRINYLNHCLLLQTEMKRKVKSKNNIIKEVTGLLGRRECIGQYYEYCLILSIDKDMKIQFFL